jgi:catechol 1,2-dioxygenase
MYKEDNAQLINNLTKRVIEAYFHIEDPRTRELVVSLIKHLQNYVKEVKITPVEFDFAWNFLAKMAHFTHDTEQKYTPENRNEFLLMSDIIGISELIELLNYPHEPKTIEVSLLGPFYLAGVPFRERGASVVIDKIPGTRLLLSGVVLDETNHKPIENAVIDFWQCDTRGMYETVDPSIPKGNLRGKFKTDAKGTFEFTCLYPTAYPIPIDGPSGDLIRIAKRKHYRAAHLHFIISAPGYKPFVTQIFAESEVKLEDDPTFAATRNNLLNFIKDGDRYRLAVQFSIVPGSGHYPVSPMNE